MSFVYFIKPIGMDGPIKIGCSKRPEERLKAFVAWLPFPLEIIATTPGSFKLEFNIQDCFADAHVHGEWFRPVPELVDAIRKIAGGVPVEQAIDLTKRGHARRKRAWTENHSKRRSYETRLHFARRRASKISGKWCDWPADITAVIHRWSRDVDAVPTAAETAMLEAMIADPVSHCPASQYKFAA